MDPAEQSAAAAAAANWREEQERQQRLLSELAARAEAAELSLAELRLGGGDGMTDAEGDLKGATVPGAGGSTGKVKSLTGE